jgi:hypothetical protein
MQHAKQQRSHRNALLVACSVIEETKGFHFMQKKGGFTSGDLSLMTFLSLCAMMNSLVHSYFYLVCGNTSLAVCDHYVKMAIE